MSKTGYRESMYSKIPQPPIPGEEERMSDHTVEEFKPGQNVRYVPYHAHGDLNHPDCENGKVTSIGHSGFIFVRFKGETSQACHPDQLVIVP